MDDRCRAPLTHRTQDLALFNVVDNAVREVPDALDKFPRLKTHHELIQERPRIQAYLASDRRPAN